MDIKTISVALVAVMVGAVMFGALIPIFDDVTATEDKFSNAEGAQSYMEKIGTDTESYTFVFDGTNNPGFITVNGEDVVPNKGTLFCVDDVGLIRNYLGKIDSSFNTIRLEFGAFSEIVTSVNLSIVNGVCTYTCSYDETTRTIDLTNGGFGIIDKGNYVMTDATQDKYLNADSEIYAEGLTSVNGGVWNTMLSISGTIDDGVTITNVYPPAQDSTTFTDITIVKSDVDSHIDLYDMDKITFTATYGANTPTSCTYNRVIIPAEVTAERAVHVTGSEGAIMDLIPLIIGMGLVLMTVGFFLRKKL